MPNLMVVGSAALGRCLGHEVEPSQMGLVPLLKKLHKLPSLFHHVKTQWEVCCLEEGPYGPCWHLGLRFSDSGTEEYIFVVYMPSGL